MTGEVEPVMPFVLSSRVIFDLSSAASATAALSAESPAGGCAARANSQSVVKVTLPAGVLQHSTNSSKTFSMAAPATSAVP